MSCAVAVPERFVIDARAIREPGGASLADRPVIDSTVGAVTLGQGCFGTISSMAWNDVPVAVKELSASTLDAASVGKWNAAEPSAGVFRLQHNSKCVCV